MAEKRGNDGSLFRGALIGTPIAIGGGIGISRFRKDSNFFGGSVSKLPNEEAFSAISNFTNRYADKANSGVLKDWQLNKLNKLAGETVLSASEIQEAWIRAARSVDPEGNTASWLADRMIGKTSQEIMNDVTFHVQQGSSSHLQRTASAFLRDINTLERFAGRLQTTDLIGTTRRHEIIPRAFDVLIRSALPPKLEGDLSSIEKALGNAGVTLTRVSRGGAFEGYSELRMKITGGILPEFGPDWKGIEKGLEIKIPGVSTLNEGIVTLGGTMQTRYIAGTYGLVEGGVLKESFNHEQYMIRRVAEELVPQLQKEKRLTQRRAHDLTHTFTENMMKNLENVRMIPKGVHSGWDEYIDFQSRRMRLMTPEGKPLPLEEYANVLGAGGLKKQGGGFLPLYPGTSPTHMIKGVAFPFDYASKAYPIGPSVDYARRPMQYLRPGYAPTAAARMMMDIPTEAGWIPAGRSGGAYWGTESLNQRFAWAKMGIGVETPFVPTAYISPKYSDVLQGRGITTEGMGIISSAYSGQREVEEVISGLEVSMGNTSPWVAERTPGIGTGKSVWQIGETAGGDVFLGWSPEGKPVVLPAGANVEAIAAHTYDSKKGDFLKVIATQTTRGEGPASKVFGGGKAMLEEKGPGFLKEVMKEGLSATHLANIGAALSMDELRKNRHLFHQQLFTSLQNYLQFQMSSGKQISSLASNFANNPAKVLQTIGAVASAEGTYSTEEAIKFAYQIAKGGGLSNVQMGAVFGAVPEVVGENWAGLMPGLGMGAKTEIERGLVMGFSQFFYGGPGAEGAGKRATIEPRLMEMLSAPQLGEVGLGIQKEIAERMMIEYPERFAEQKAYSTALKSLLGGGAVEGIDIPLGDERGRLAKAYGAALEGGEGTRKKLMEEISRAWAGTVTGKDLGLARNRLPGSKFLTLYSASQVGSPLSDPYTIGITEGMASDMLQDLEKTYGEKEVTGLRKRFMTGRTIAGFGFRHPIIGPYSLQPLKFQRIAGEGSYAVANEILRKVSIPSLGEELGNMRFSPLVGMGADTDADAMAASLVSPQLEKNLTTHINNQTSLDLYEQYTVRKQLLKKSAGLSNIPIREEMKEAALRLGIAKQEIGLISNALGTGRAAILQSGLSGEERANALFVLDYLEQTPILAKHIKAGKAEKMLGLFRDIKVGIEKKDADRLARIVTESIDLSKSSQQAAIREGFEYMTEDVVTGELARKRLPALPIHQTTRNITNAIAAMETNKVGQITAKRMHELHRAKGFAPTLAEMGTMLTPEAARLSPFGPFFVQPPPPTGIAGGAAKLSAHMTAISNKVAATGRGLLKYARPLGIGTGVAIGIATVLSEPSMSLSPEDKIPPRPIMKSGTGGAEIGTNLHLDTRQVQGSPTTRNPVRAGNTARIAGPARLSKRISIDGVSNRAIDYQELNGQIRQAIGGRARINSSVDDRRMSLNSQKLSDILND